MIRPPPRSPLFPYTPLFRSSTADHHDVPSLETTEVPVLGGMRDQFRRQPDELVRSIGIVRDADRHYDRLTLHLAPIRSEEHTSELQSQSNLVCRLLLEKKKN